MNIGIPSADSAASSGHDFYRLTDGTLELLEDFKDIMPLKDLEQLKEDHSDPEENLGYLCRLKFTFKRGNYARLRELIDAINDLD